MPNFRYSDGRLPKEELATQVEPFADKLLWFMQRGYVPHYWQILFHTAQREGELCRFRHLVAGRRGGKTLSAAWETLFYSLFPGVFHKHAHGTDSTEPLWIWVLTKDYPAGRPALLTFRKVLQQAGLVHGVDYKEHRGNRYFEFENGTLIEFKTGDDPESLRGAGLDILWMDEAAFIASKDAYNVVSPALADKSGLVISTTTPAGKNWFYDTFWNDEAMKSPDIARIEYRSLDSPYFPKKEWEHFRQTYHPLLFKQEFMASFDAMQGRDLLGEWLRYYQWDDLPKRRDDPKTPNLKLYMGVDPAVSLADSSDSFAMALIGVTEDNTQAYLIKTFKGRIPFPEQVDLIKEWHIEHRPQLIGVEATAYQKALVQQLERLPGLPPIIPIFAKGDKTRRILSMSPLFKIGRIKIREDQRDFIDEWLDYDASIRNPKDDMLDAVEICLRTAGALLPDAPMPALFTAADRPAADMNELAARHIPGGKWDTKSAGVDENMGAEW